MLTNEVLGQGHRDKMEQEEKELQINPFLKVERDKSRRPYLKLLDPDPQFSSPTLKQSYETRVGRANCEAFDLFLKTHQDTNATLKKFKKDLLNFNIY